MKTYKKHFLIVLKKFWKLKIIAFLKWPRNLNIQRLLQKCIEIFEADLKKQQQRQQKIRFQRNKKVPAIQPFLVNDKFVSDFCKRTNLFNNIFTSICTSNKMLKHISMWKSKTRVQLYELQVQIQKLRVQIHGLHVWIHKLRVRIYELRVWTLELRVNFHEMQARNYE